jgi:hypothetical protein
VQSGADTVLVLEVVLLDLIVEVMGPFVLVDLMLEVLAFTLELVDLVEDVLLEDFVEELLDFVLEVTGPFVDVV